MYISITGIKPRNFFTTHNFGSSQYQHLERHKNLKVIYFVKLKKRDSYYHTITAWKNRSMMMKYLTGKAHSKAMKNFSLIGTGSHMDMKEIKFHLKSY